MKLAEALALRADRQRKFEQLKARAVAVARFQEGEQPPENANELVASAQEVVADLEGLIRQINRTNSETRLGDGRTVTAAMAERDALRLRFQLLTDVADAATGEMTRHNFQLFRQMRSELRVMSAVPVTAVRNEADDIARQLRELDAQVQEVNWTTELLED